ncbi:MAG: HDOD domain-containing protein [Helicobacteraceae bacterium]|nr:HDOD domain-containing protein [Helicobacteraceae bacterium]
MKSSIIDNIKSLPPLPKSIAQIQAICADSESGIGDLVKVVQGDPMIVANLLKEANSPLYCFNRELKNVAQAVSLFGMNMTRSIALANAAKKLLNTDMKPYGITSEDFANTSALQASFIKKWYSQIDMTKADDLFLVALLQESGKILIANDLMRDNRELEFRSEVEFTSNIAFVEQEYIGDTAGAVTALLFEHWDFEKKFIDMLRFSDNINKADEDIKEYAVALYIAKSLFPVNQPLSEQSINFTLSRAQTLGLDVALLEDVIENMKEIVNE